MTNTGANKRKHDSMTMTILITHNTALYRRKFCGTRLPLLILEMFNEKTLAKITWGCLTLYMYTQKQETYKAARYLNAGRMTLSVYVYMFEDPKRI